MTFVVGNKTTHDAFRPLTPAVYAALHDGTR